MSVILIKFYFWFIVGSKSEEPSPVAVPFVAVVTPPKAATPAPLPSVNPEQAEENERPLERATVPELRSELSKAPLHTNLPNSIVEAISIPHITNAHPGNNQKSETYANTYSKYFLMKKFREC